MFDLWDMILAAFVGHGLAIIIVALAAGIVSKRALLLTLIPLVIILYRHYGG